MITKPIITQECNLKPQSHKYAIGDVLLSTQVSFKNYGIHKQNSISQVEYLFFTQVSFENDGKGK